MWEPGRLQPTGGRHSSALQHPVLLVQMMDGTESWGTIFKPQREGGVNTWGGSLLYTKRSKLLFFEEKTLILGKSGFVFYQSQFREPFKV